MVKSCRFTIPGPPRTKKAHNQLVTLPGAYDPLTQARGRGFQKVLPSKQYMKWFACAMTYALMIKTQIREQGFEPPIQGRLRVTALFYLPNEAHVGDLVGYEQALGDFLQAPTYDPKTYRQRRDGAGIIQDDKQISSWGESSRDLRDKVNPRVEICIEVLE
jgi:hypothetical protein